jgi:hypothetical protein
MVSHQNSGLRDVQVKVGTRGQPRQLWRHLAPSWPKTARSALCSLDPAAPSSDRDRWQTAFPRRPAPTKLCSKFRASSTYVCMYVQHSNHNICGLGVRRLPIFGGTLSAILSPSRGQGLHSVWSALGHPATHRSAGAARPISWVPGLGLGGGATSRKWRLGSRLSISRGRAGLESYLEPTRTKGMFGRSWECRCGMRGLPLNDGSSG